VALTLVSVSLPLTSKALLAGIDSAVHLAGVRVYMNELLTCISPVELALYKLLQRNPGIADGRPSLSNDMCCRCGAVLPAEEGAAPPLAAAASGASEGSEVPASTRTVPLRVCGACLHLGLEPLSISAGPNVRPRKRQRAGKPGELAAETRHTLGGLALSPRWRVTRPA
jgi:hypothetical protein